LQSKPIFYEKNGKQMYGRDLFPPEKLVAEGFIPSRKTSGGVYLDITRKNCKVRKYGKTVFFLIFH
jgi:hypothetical protein